MKRFLLFILIGAVTFFVFDKTFIVFLNHSPKVQVDKRVEMILNGEMNHELIVMGSSRGARDILAGQVEEETGLSSYNLSYPGSDVEFHEFLLRTLLEFNKAPEMLVLTVDAPYELWPSTELVFRNDRLYPLTKYPYVLDELVDRGEKNRFLSRFFVLHKLSRSSFRIRPIGFTALDSISSNGSMPISWKDESLKFEFYNDSLIYNLDMEVQAKVRAFQKIDSTCQVNNIKLILLYPPNFSNFNEAFRARLSQLVSETESEIIYNQGNPIYRNKEYYFDDGHLTIEGAQIFTSELSDRLNKLIK